MRIRYAVLLLLGFVVAFWTDGKVLNASPWAVVHEPKVTGLIGTENVGICAASMDVYCLFAASDGCLVIWRDSHRVATCRASLGADRHLRHFGTRWRNSDEHSPIWVVENGDLGPHTELLRRSLPGICHSHLSSCYSIILKPQVDWIGGTHIGPQLAYGSLFGFFNRSFGGFGASVTSHVGSWGYNRLTLDMPRRSGLARSGRAASCRNRKQMRGRAPLKAPFVQRARSSQIEARSDRGVRA